MVASVMTPEDLAAELDAGRSYAEIARRWGGITKDGVHRRAKRWGLKSQNPAKHPGSPVVWFEGARRNLHEVARLAGVHYHTVWRRYQRGYTGKALARPARRKKTVPRCYDLDISIADWREYAAMAREIGLKTTANRTGLPYGALAAAVRGEWDRLG